MGEELLSDIGKLIEYYRANYRNIKGKRYQKSQFIYTMDDVPICGLSTYTNIANGIAVKKTDFYKQLAENLGMEFELFFGLEFEEEY